MWMGVPQTRDPRCGPLLLATHTVTAGAGETPSACWVGYHTAPVLSWPTDRNQLYHCDRSPNRSTTDHNSTPLDILGQVTDLQKLRAEILEFLSSEGAPLVKSPSVSPPSNAGSLVVPLDEDAMQTTGLMLRRLAPSVLILGTRDDDQVSFDLHMVGAPWMQLLYVTPEALALADEEDADQTDGLTESELSALSIAVEVLASSTPLSSHGGVAEAQEQLLSFLEKANPPLHAKMSRPWMRYHKHGSVALNILLKDRHGAFLRDEAENLARRVIADEKLTPKMTRTLLRDRIYSHFKRQDPTCVTRPGIEGIYFEAANLLSAEHP